MTDSDPRFSAASADAFFESRDFAESNFREMEVQICGETRTVQFSTSDHGGDHPTSPSVAIDWAMARDLATWVLARTGAPAQSVGMREALESARGEIVLAVAFLGRDLGTDRLNDTVDSLITRLAKADADARAALAQPSPALTVEVPPEVMERRRKGLSDYEKPPLGQPPSWLQEQEKKQPEHSSAATEGDVHSYLDRSAVRAILIEQDDDDREIMEAVLQDIDALPVITPIEPQPVRESVLICPLCGAPDDALACDNLKCPGTAVPRSSLLPRPHGGGEK